MPWTNIRPDSSRRLLALSKGEKAPRLLSGPVWRIAELRCAARCCAAWWRCAARCGAALHRAHGGAGGTATSHRTAQRRGQHGSVARGMAQRGALHHVGRVARRGGAVPCVGAASVRLQQLCCQFTTFAAARLRERTVFAAARAVGNCRFRAFLARGFRAVFAGRFFSLLLGLLVFRGFRHGLLLCFSLVMIPNRYQLAMANSYAG